MEKNKYMILPGEPSEPQDLVCAQGLPRCLGRRPEQQLSGGLSVHSTGGGGVLMSTGRGPEGALVKAVLTPPPVALHEA